MKLIDELSELHAKTTVGEWYAIPTHNAGAPDPDDHDIWVDMGLTIASMGGGYGELGEKPNNAAFIAAAHNAMPEIAAYVRGLQEALRFYADDQQYVAHTMGGTGMNIVFFTPVLSDNGDRARQALGETDGE